MLYVEDALAGVLRCAAGLELVPGIDEAHVFTDEDAENEWQGENKVYVLRGESLPIYDVTSPTGHSGAEISELGLISIAARRSEAQELAAAVWESVRAKLADDENAAEYTGSEPVDFLEEVKTASSLFHLSSDDEFSLGTADQFKASAFDFAGEVEIAGALIGGVVFRPVGETVSLRTSNLGIYDWLLDRYTTAARADGGAFRDQWFSTYTIKAIHSI